MYQPTHLPPKVDLETKAILKKLVKAHSALAELKGVASTIPNENILIKGSKRQFRN
jgi:Fic family protein